MGFDVLTIFQRKDMKPVDIGLYIKSESKEETYEVKFANFPLYKPMVESL